MKSNPGGQIDLAEVVGREAIVTHIRETLMQQSVLLNAERRIGKTTVLRVIRDQPPAGWRVVFMDLEQYHTAYEFANAVFKEAGRFLLTKQKVARHVGRFLDSIGGAEVGGVLKIPERVQDAVWKDILVSTIRDIFEACDHQSDKPLFLWDEVPLMLQNIVSREGESTAMEVLDTLRSLRQTWEPKGLRMVLTGSIGLHHVIDHLQTEGYTNSPVNDVLSIELSPLSSTAGIELAQKLLDGEEIETDDRHETATAIAEVSDCFPFYIHHIVKALKIDGAPGDKSSVEEVVSRQLRDANDPWELNHYQERIADYYGVSFQETVLAILDGMASSKQGKPFADILRELQNLDLLDDREALLRLLKLLEKDHYLMKNIDNAYQFKYSLLQRWWILSREL